MARMKNRRRCRGLEMVETALLLPILVLFTMGIFEYGWMILKAHELTNITRQAARLDAMPDATQASVNSTIQQMMSAVGLTYQAPVYTVTTQASGQQIVTVTITTPYTGLTNFPGLPLPANLQATVAMTIENP